MMSKFDDDPAAGLTITGVAARTGVSAPALRAWEQRYGFPRPVRLPGGHRRYPETEVVRIEAVVAERAAGRSLEAAIARAVAEREPAPGEVDGTLFAALRRSRPDLALHVLSRTGMLALSRAIEDEAAARGDRPHFAAAFQRADVYRRARSARWRTLARHAASTLVFADFARSRLVADGVAEIAIPPRSAQEREWAVVCEGASAAVLAGWERPDGRFEAVWSVEPDVVRTAGSVARSLAGRAAPALELPTDPPPLPGSLDALRTGTAIASRAIAYLDR